MTTQTNPFLTRKIPGRPDVGAVDAESRIQMVQEFSIDQCNQALHIPRLQKTVVLAILRRVRKIAQERKARREKEATR